MASVAEIQRKLGDSAYLHDAGTLKWFEPKADWSKAYISYDLSAERDILAWKGDWNDVEGNI